MRYKPKSIAALQVALGGLPDAMHVEADRGIGVSAKTVGELRKVASWPDNLVITTPQARYPESAIKVSKTSVATRVSPNPKPQFVGLPLAIFRCPAEHCFVKLPTA
jgi:hypothetical protein